jgi:hypothetical protein
MNMAIWAVFRELARPAPEDHLLRSFGFLPMGAVMFAVTTPIFLAYSGAVDAARVGAFAAYGLTFPIWGTICAIAGIIGVIPMALLTGWAFWSATRSWLLACAPVLALVPAWLLAGLAVDDEITIYPDLFNAVGAWNVTVACVVAAWAHVEHHRLPRHTPSCVSCGYELSGLESAICPECGQPTPIRSCRHCGRDLRGPDARGLRLRKCPECGRMTR